MKLNSDDNVKIITSRDELIFMFRRLAIDVLEHPDWFKWGGDFDGVLDFYRGENHRRSLEGRTEPYVDKFFPVKEFYTSNF